MSSAPCVPSKISTLQRVSVAESCGAAEMQLRFRMADGRGASPDSGPSKCRPRSQRHRPSWTRSSELHIRNVRVVCGSTERHTPGNRECAQVSCTSHIVSQSFERQHAQHRASPTGKTHLTRVGPACSAGVHFFLFESLSVACVCLTVNVRSEASPARVSCK